MSFYPKIHEAAFVIAHDSGCTGRDMGSDVAPRILGLLTTTAPGDLAGYEAFLLSLSAEDFQTVLIGETDEAIALASKGPPDLECFLDEIHEAVTNPEAENE